MSVRRPNCGHRGHPAKVTEECHTLGYVFEVSDSDSGYFVEELPPGEDALEGDSSSSTSGVATVGAALWEWSKFHEHVRAWKQTRGFCTHVEEDAFNEHTQAVALAGCVNMPDSLWSLRAQGSGLVSEQLVEQSVNCQLIPGFSISNGEFCWTGAWLWITKQVEAGEWLELDYGDHFFDAHSEDTT
jgi:hypothetical protein